MLTTLSKEKFGDFETYEVLVRNYEKRKFKEQSIFKPDENATRGNRDEKDRFVFAQPNSDDRWHTGYLTFCSKF